MIINIRLLHLQAGENITHSCWSSNQYRTAASICAKLFLYRAEMEKVKKAEQQINSSQAKY